MSLSIFSLLSPLQSNLTSLGEPGGNAIPSDIPAGVDFVVSMSLLENMFEENINAPFISEHKNGASSGMNELIVVYDQSDSDDGPGATPVLRIYSNNPLFARWEGLVPEKEELKRGKSTIIGKNSTTETDFILKCNFETKSKEINTDKYDKTASRYEYDTLLATTKRVFIPSFDVHARAKPNSSAMSHNSCKEYQKCLCLSFPYYPHCNRT